MDAAGSGDAGAAGPFDAEVDLLVIGAGAGGMSAALTGAIAGLEVLLCEKTGMVGGTTATSGGTIWVPGNALGRIKTWFAPKSAAKPIPTSEELFDIWSSR